uniref:Ion_trans domain-containing protein n=1 Tax=Macrostomum lignano TaxID=282301 RepID=A0A1I8I9S6_9PLAT
MAFLTLFRIATGDNWNGIMKDTLREKCDWSDDCIKNCCVSPIIAPIYFVVFVLMAQFVLVNVVVAVLMKHLEESHKMMSDDEELEKEIRRELEEENRENQRQMERQERERKEESLSAYAFDEQQQQKQQPQLQTFLVEHESNQVTSPIIQSCRISCSDRLIERRLSSIYDRQNSLSADSSSADKKRRRYSEIRLGAFEVAPDTNDDELSLSHLKALDTRPVTDL